MEQQGDEVHASETEASGGSKEGVVRWVLIIGTLLAIGFLTVIWVTGAASQGDVEEEATVSGIIDSQADADRGEPIAPAFDEEAPVGDDASEASAADAQPEAQ